MINQGYEAGAQAMLQGWSRSPKLGGKAGAWNLGSSSTALVCGGSELYK